MFSFKVGDKEYKVKFGYRVLAGTDLIERVSEISTRKNGKSVLQDMLQTLGELILAGLQKNHSEEFGYTTESEKSEALNKVYDLLDLYEDESTEENPQNGFILFEKANDELMKNGFLSQMMKIGEEAAKKQDATVIPQDHKAKKKP